MMQIDLFLSPSKCISRHCVHASGAWYKQVRNEMLNSDVSHVHMIKPCLCSIKIRTVLELLFVMWMFLFMEALLISMKRWLLRLSKTSKLLQNVH